MELNVFANRTATFINRSAILLNSVRKKPLNGIILDICVLDDFISVGMLFSNAFFNFAFCFVVNNNSWGKLFPLICP